MKPLYLALTLINLAQYYCKYFDPSVQSILPEVSFFDLEKLDKSAAIFAANSLVTFGAIQITNIPNFGASRKTALESLGACLSSDMSAAQRTMNDGSSRSTIDAITTNGVVGPMSSTCGDPSSSLRQAVDVASKKLFSALDLAVRMKQTEQGTTSTSAIMTPYASFTDLVEHGSHLEHLHTYFGGKSSMSGIDFNGNKPTLDVHMDSGLFIAMTTGYWNDNTESSVATRGVYIETPTGSLSRMVSADDALIIMVGDGGARWLSPVLGAPLRAVPHALYAAVANTKSLNEEVTRSWYGKMFLPPQDAIIYELSMTYAEFRQRQLNIITSNLPAATEQGVDTSLSFPLACGHFGLNTAASSSSQGSYRGMLATTMPMCKPDELKCWMTCYSTKNLTCGMDAVCVDIVTDEVVPGEDMCPDGDGNCKLMCVTYNTSNYCYGSGITMDMTGFVTAPQHGDAPCFNLWFTHWTLDSRSKFAVACFGVFFLGIFVQLLTQFRTNFSKTYHGWKLYKPAAVLLYGFQTTVSYFVMLVAMTYSSELFAMTCLGLTIGYGIINIDITSIIKSINSTSHSNPVIAEERCCEENDDGLTSKLI